MQKKFQKGQTLLELVVAVGIFVIIIAIVTVIFVNGVTNQRKTIATQDVADNARYAIEVMSKEIRTGFDFSNPASDTTFKFENYQSETVTYCLAKSNSADCDSSGNILAKKTEEKNGTKTFSLLTSDKVKVSQLQFSLSGQSDSDDLQPKVTIVMKIEPTISNSGQEMNLQTTIVSRCLDIKNSPLSLEQRCLLSSP